MKALVTGANGFIGKNLIHALTEGGWQVLCADLNRPQPNDTKDTMHWITVDCRSPQAIKQSRLLADVDVVFHLAGLTRARSEAQFFEANVTPVKLLLEEIDKGQSAIHRFVLISSQTAAGPAVDLRHPVIESDAPRPVEAYGRSKLAAERVAMQFSKRLPVTIIRPGGVYGPGDRDFFLLYQWIRRGLSIYPGTYHQWFSPIYIDDLVSGLIAAGTAENTVNETYFLCQDTPMQWREIHAIMARIAGRRPLPIPIPAALIAHTVDLLAHTLGRNRIPPKGSHKIAMARPRYWVASPKKARRDFKFNAAVPFIDGFTDTCQWYHEKGWLR